MATYIQGIQTSVGVVKYDYNYLANLPESDMTLSKQGAFADALVVGRKLTSFYFHTNLWQSSPSPGSVVPFPTALNFHSPLYLYISPKIIAVIPE